MEEPVLRDSPTGRYSGGELPKPLVKILGNCWTNKTAGFVTLGKKKSWRFALVVRHLATLLPSEKSLLDIFEGGVKQSSTDSYQTCPAVSVPSGYLSSRVFSSRQHNTALLVMGVTSSAETLQPAQPPDRVGRSGCQAVSRGAAACCVQLHLWGKEVQGVSQMEMQFFFLVAAPMTLLVRLPTGWGLPTAWGT